MNLTLENYKNLSEIIQSIATVISFIIGGIWIYLKYIRQQEKYPNIEFFVDINFIGIQKNYWIVELVAIIENKGKVQHKMSDFYFDLNGLSNDSLVELNDKWNNQVDFPIKLSQGTFLPKKYQFFFIDPGTKATYSFITRIPIDIKFVIFHSWFKYGDKRDFSHAAECTKEVSKKTK